MNYTCSLKIVWGFKPPYTEPYDPIISDRLGRAAKALWDDTVRGIDPERIEECMHEGPLAPVPINGPSGSEPGIDIPTMKAEIRRRLWLLKPDVALDIVNNENWPFPYRYLINPPTCDHSYGLTLDGELLKVESPLAPLAIGVLAVSFAFTRTGT